MSSWEGHSSWIWSVSKYPSASTPVSNHCWWPPLPLRLRILCWYLTCWLTSVQRVQWTLQGRSLWAADLGSTWTLSSLHDEWLHWSLLGFDGAALCSYLKRRSSPGSDASLESWRDGFTSVFLVWCLFALLCLVPGDLINHLVGLNHLILRYCQSGYFKSSLAEWATKSPVSVSFDRISAWISTGQYYM